MKLEHQLRELCAYYEWSEPPNLAAADALQGAADALKHGKISDDIAEALIRLWKPFAAFEQPTVAVVAQTETELEDAILADMERMMLRENNTAKKAHLQRLIKEQMQIFRKRDVDA